MDVSIHYVGEISDDLTGTVAFCPTMQTLTFSLGLLRGQYGAVPTLIAAGVVIAVTPVILMYLLAQEQLIKGMTMGAVKS